MTSKVSGPYSPMSFAAVFGPIPFIARLERYLSISFSVAGMQISMYAARNCLP